MSNVLRRNRTISDVAYLNNAYRIREEMVSIINNEKIVPKRYKFTYAVPIMEMCRSLEANAITYSNCIGEDDEFFTLYNRKKIALLNILDIVKQLFNELQQMKRQFMNIKIARFDKIIGMLLDEQKLAESMLLNVETSHINITRSIAGM